MEEDKKKTYTRKHEHLRGLYTLQDLMFIMDERWMGLGMGMGMPVECLWSLPMRKCLIHSDLDSNVDCFDSDFHLL